MGAGASGVNMIFFVGIRDSEFLQIVPQVSNQFYRMVTKKTRRSIKFRQVRLFKTIRLYSTVTDLARFRG